MRAGLAVLGLLGAGPLAGGNQSTAATHQQPAAATSMDHVAPKERAGSVVGFDVVVSRATPATVTEGARSAENIDVVIATETEAGPVLSHRRSRDGGQTWSKDTPIDMHGTTISNAMRGLDPAVAAHGDRLFVVWTTPGEGSHGVGPFATATSDDGGKTWQPGANPSDDGTKRGHAFIDAIADDAGVFHVVWLETRGSRGVIAASSNDFGRTWAANRVVDGKTCECCWNELLSIRPGETHLLYRDTAPRDMAIARTTDSGASWERLATVGDYKWPIEACPFTGGGLAATGPTGRETLHATVFSGEKAHRGVTYLTSPDRGVSWSAPLALGEGRGQHSDIAALGEHLVAVFDRTDSEDGFVVVSRDSKDAGQTWSATRRLSRTGVKADFPRVVSVAGRVVGFWTEKGEDAVVRLAEALLSPADAESEAPVGGTRRD